MPFVRLSVSLEDDEDGDEEGPWALQHDGDIQSLCGEDRTGGRVIDPSLMRNKLCERKGCLWHMVDAQEKLIERT